MANPVGHCHICNTHGPLTFEHVPPRRTFNQYPALLMTVDDISIASKHQRQMPPSRRYPRGLGRNALCSRCNGSTGDEYGDAFCRWTLQAVRYADKTGSSNEIYVPFTIEPLRVIKQIAVMALAASDFAPGYQRSLQRFARVAFERFVPDDYRIFVYLNPNIADKKLPPNRMTGAAALLDVTGGPTVVVMAEIALPPMGYLILHSNDGGPEQAMKHGLCEITHFGNYPIGKEITLWLRLRAKRPIGPFPLNYAK